MEENENASEFPTLYTVEEAAAIVRLRPMTLWQHLNAGKLQRTKVGGRTFIRASELQKMIRDLPLGPNAERHLRPQPRKKEKARKAGAR